MSDWDSFVGFASVVVFELVLDGGTGGVVERVDECWN